MESPKVPGTNHVGRKLNQGNVREGPSHRQSRRTAQRNSKSRQVAPITAGSEASQGMIDAVMQAQEVTQALAERAAQTAASSEVLDALGEQAAAQERAFVDDIRRRRAEAMKQRVETELGELDSAVDELIAANRQTLDELRLLSEQKVQAATAHAETRLAIMEAKEEIAARDELAATLEELTAKIERTAELEAAAMEARIAAGKKRLDALRAKFASDNASEKMAALEQALASGDENLRRIALTAAFRSGSDDLQGVALAAYLAELPQMSIVVSKSKTDGAETYLQMLRIAESNDNSFAGKLTTPNWLAVGEVSGSIQGDPLFLDAQFKRSGQNGQCA